MGGAGAFPPQHRRTRGLPHIHLLRRTAVGQWHAGHSPCDGAHHKRHFLSLQNDARLPSASQSGLGHTRSARRTRRGKDARYHQRGYRQKNQCGRIQRRLPPRGDEIYQRVDGTHPENGLLGRFGQSVYHLRQQIHRNALVAASATLQ